MKPWQAFLLVVAVLALASLACGTDPEWDAWQVEVQQRQQQGLPTATAEVAP